MVQVTILPRSFITFLLYHRFIWWLILHGFWRPITRRLNVMAWHRDARLSANRVMASVILKWRCFQTLRMILLLAFTWRYIGAQKQLAHHLQVNNVSLFKNAVPVAVTGMKTKFASTLTVSISNWKSKMCILYLQLCSYNIAEIPQEYTLLN